MKENNKITCASCGQLISPDAATPIIQGFDNEMQVCPDCLFDCFQCGHCGRYYTRRHEWATDNGFTICNPP